MVLWNKKEQEVSEQLFGVIENKTSTSEEIQQLSIQFGFQLPVYDPVSSNFGSRSGYDSNGFHKGIDFASSIGTKVHASLAGEVIVAQEDGAPYDGYGKVVVIRHDNGTWTLYGHQSNLFVSVGERVETSQVIGEVGETGHSEGPHLHLEIRANPTGGVDSVVDPVPLLEIRSF